MSHPSTVTAPEQAASKSFHLASLGPLVGLLMGVAALSVSLRAYDADELMRVLGWGESHTHVALGAATGGALLASWVVGAISEVKGGSFPSYAQGYYPRNNAFYKQWDHIARERETFKAWIERHIMSTNDFDGFRRSLVNAGMDAG